MVHKHGSDMSGIGVGVVLALIALGGAQDPAVDASSMEQDPDRLYGRVATADGEVFEGYLRWDGNESHWTDVLDGLKEVPTQWEHEAERLDPDYAAEKRRSRSLVAFGVRLTWDVDDDLGPPVSSSGIRFVHVRALEPIDARSVRATLTSGDEITLHWSSADIGQAMRGLVVEVPGAGTVELGWRDLERVDFTEAPGFTSEVELRERFDDLADLPASSAAHIPSTLRWGLQRPDLARFNRVEGLSVGIRGQIRPTTVMGQLSMTGTAGIGLGDLEPNLRAEIAHEGLRRRISLSGYNEIASIEEGARHLRLGNSLMSALFGRDDGDYYYRSGASLEWLPPSAARRAYRVRTYAEYQRPASVATEFAVFQFWKEGWTYRPNIAAEEGWEYGAVLDVNPWWGSDPLLTQGGFDLMVHGATGMADYARASLTGRIVVPLPSAMRVALEAGGGTSWGDVTEQRLWFVGGSRTLRGYGPRIAGGTNFTRGRLEIARTFVWGALSLFSDYGWAGTWDRYRISKGYTSAGFGLSILDGLIHLDAAHGLTDPKGFRLDFYLDGIL